MCREEDRSTQQPRVVSVEALDCYARISANLRRMLETIGLERRAKDIGPTLGQLIRADQEAERQRLARECEQTKASS
jgi:hypothetical protein